MRTYNETPWTIRKAFPDQPFRTKDILMPNTPIEAIDAADLATIAVTQVTHYTNFPPYSYEEGNAKRIVDCVNACEGLENLEEISLASLLKATRDVLDYYLTELADNRDNAIDDEAEQYWQHDYDVSREIANKISDLLQLPHLH